MKKIMFNDRYELTQSVLEGHKTMTRRIIPQLMATDNYYVSDWKSNNGGKAYVCVYKGGCHIEIYPAYQIGEIVAVAQKYIDLCNCSAFYEALSKADPTFPLECIKGEKGCNNKMFVKAAWMPHRIKITNIKIERLQDISDDDCFKEGIRWDYADYPYMNEKTYFFTDYEGFESPRMAFSKLINRVCGKSTWELNPWVLAYEFELVK